MASGLAGMAEGIAQSNENMKQATRRIGQAVEAGEGLIQAVNETGVETDDSPFIAYVSELAQNLGQLLETAIADGRLQESVVFSDDYQPIAGSDPEQFNHPLTGFTDDHFTDYFEQALGFDARVVTCATVDRNGFVPTHNRKYSHTPRPGDAEWNEANCRNRRFYKDSANMKVAKSRKAFHLQTYRRNIGDGTVQLLKDVSVPITVSGRHWGAARLVYNS